jgi:hypothetical protein
MHQGGPSYASGCPTFKDKAGIRQLADARLFYFMLYQKISQLVKGIPFLKSISDIR